MLWNNNFVDLHNIIIRHFSISATVELKESNLSFLMTVVYGPTRGMLKPSFLRELHRCKPDEGSKWLLLGDFNLIYRA